MTSPFPTIANPLVLAGEGVRLRPVTLADVASVVAASSGDRTSYGFTNVPHDERSARRYVENLVAERLSGTSYSFVIEDGRRHEVVGMTRYLTLRWWFAREAPDAVEIGGTWLAARAQRTGVNTAAKRLMLSHAFDEWGVARVDFKTDARNDQSRRALERLGASFEGVLHSWQPSARNDEQGLPRDSAMYAVVREHWPEVRARLDNRRY
ncbi:MAG: GNAT family N-acetyltransferase [Acidobacteriota bacterium]|nr:GNAT family N-acetyltransferase [Acidobacteriota bacterium]